MTNLPEAVPSTIPCARVPWATAATLDSASIINCTNAEFSPTATTFPTRPFPYSEPPRDGETPTTGLLSFTPCALPLSIRTHSCHRVGDHLFTRAVTNLEPSGKMSALRKSRACFNRSFSSLASSNSMTLPLRLSISRFRSRFSSIAPVRSPTYWYPSLNGLTARVASDCRGVRLPAPLSLRACRVPDAGSRKKPSAVPVRQLSGRRRETAAWFHCRATWKTPDESLTTPPGCLLYTSPSPRD